MLGDDAALLRAVTRASKSSSYMAHERRSVLAIACKLGWDIILDSSKTDVSGKIICLYIP